MYDDDDRINIIYNLISMGIYICDGLCYHDDVYCMV